MATQNKAADLENLVYMYASIITLCFSLRAYFISVRWVTVICVAPVISACGLLGKKESPEVEAVEASEPPVYVSNVSISRDLDSPIVTQQLGKAAAFFEKGMLLKPDHDNAYIRYRAALMLDPDNVDAKSGLNGILVSQAGDIKRLLESSNFGAARKKIGQLVSLFGSSKLTDDLSESLALALEQQRRNRATIARRKTKTQKEQDNRILLDISLLNSKDLALSKTLSLIAKQVQETDQGVLIYARSDAEGRWIYQQMRKATPDYRIRGDIRIGKPGIKLLSSFE